MFRYIGFTNGNRMRPHGSVRDMLNSTNKAG